MTQVNVLNNEINIFLEMLHVFPEEQIDSIYWEYDLIWMIDSQKSVGLRVDLSLLRELNDTRYLIRLELFQRDVYRSKELKIINMVFIDIVVILLVDSFDYIVLRLIVFTIVLHLEH